MTTRVKQLMHSFAVIAFLLLLLGLVRLSELPSDKTGPTSTSSAGEAGAADAAPAERSSETVTQVIDGDTLKLGSGETVRLIGINAPEVGQPYYQEAKEALREMTLGKEARLERDVSRYDRYERRLAYVYVGEVFVNEELVARGLAKAYPYEPDTSREDTFRRAELAAQDAGRGLWSQSTGSADGAPSLSITAFQYDAPGDDTKNLAEEFFTLTNGTDTVIHLTGFRVSDTANHEYEFPSFVLGVQKSVTVHTGAGTDSATDLFWNSRDTVWNNDSDTLYLYDHRGELVLWYRY